MRATVALVLFGLLAACGGSEPVNPANTPEGRLCGRAYGSTLDSIEDMFKAAGKTMPTNLPAKEDYVKLCVEQGFSEAQAKCLDPKLASLDPEGCTTTLAPVKEKKELLSKLFASAMSAKPAPAPAPAEEPAPAEGGAAPEGE
ncbi:MAG: hypothetical protein JXX28_15090 [Deltaproteobacteria bacterium]|nr:hypothetical protein [Deltaproteobacteria bacterium]